MLPEGGDARGLTIFVNGVANSREDHVASMQALANAASTAVVGVHNATGGLLRDLVQAGKDKLGSRNSATGPLEGAILDGLKRGTPLHLVAHSQGALLVSQALGGAMERLVGEGLSRPEAEARLAAVTVETFGGAAAQWPDGPRYVHYVNSEDPVPGWLGTSDAGSGVRRRAARAGRAVDSMVSVVGLDSTLAERTATRVADTLLGYPGRGAVIKRFTDPGPPGSMSAHLFTTYLAHREPLDGPG
ncbi:MAG: hypothetical protein INH41_01110 [Myxococcaceae bacterium]|nr:hypothetical protein [Myxococcaceae bacterium]MCA3010977.1 hypothetical protein [Myxococcaceae bacterium]